MRFGLAMALILFGWVLMVNGSKYRSYNIPSEKKPPRDREIRGYRPDEISTSIGVGYGKRDGSYEISNFNRRERVLLSLLRNFPQGFRITPELILRETKTNPYFAGKSTEMIINDDNGQTPIGEQLQPEGTIFIF
ncbi:allatotropin-like isoform X1 [Polistes fuscatus]|uniref:allatotropin-like isoform X1 n=1 Tax=Polistes fuscatus TaxID=30207 RepID=UPI001CAA2DAC|nr:allatotropin-like isoform X1 [Polistes fuscatus]XP_043487779.1 allatotropin-like isoform X1 [Polistes fuscatus]